jgi:hypothetical protein
MKSRKWVGEEGNTKRKPKINKDERIEVPKTNKQSDITEKS